MSQVFTVLGPISPESLGITAIHEHLQFGMPGWEHASQEYFNRAIAFEKIKNALLDFQRRGGQTIVDCTNWSMGRDIEFYQTLSRSTGVNIIACTGFREERVIPGNLVELSEDVDFIAGLFIRELTEGMVTGFMRKTPVRAGIIKVGNSEDRITALEESFYRAAARAAQQTGAAITTHGSAMALRQLELLVGEGLDASRIIVGHCDESPDIERDKEMARKGAYVAYDRAAYDSTRRDKRRVELVKAMVDAGFATQVLISCDAIGYGHLYPEPGRSFSYLLSGLVPLLRHAGLSEETVSTILAENPKRVLAF